MISRIFAPFAAFKWYLIVALALGAGAYVLTLHKKIENAEAKNLVLKDQLADSQAEAAILTDSLTKANEAMAMATAELDKRNELTTKALAHSKHLNFVITQQKEQLAKLKQENEAYKEWLNNPVPSVVARMLKHTRDSLQNDSEDGNN